SSVLIGRMGGVSSEFEFSKSNKFGSRSPGAEILLRLAGMKLKTRMRCASLSRPDGWRSPRKAIAPDSRSAKLTFLGASEFGNEDRWVHGAMQRALDMMRRIDLDVRLVSFATPSKAIV